MKRKIVLTGPESTAKSTLSKLLASHFNGVNVPEFARDYLAKKGHSYSYDDVEAIAKGQIEQYHNSLKSEGDYVFFDTWLIVTKVWFEWVFQKEPVWLETSMTELPIDLYLLCKPDIPWEPDPLRENGGEERIKLFEIYKNELVKRKLPFIEINGEGEERVQQAIAAVKSSLL